MARWIELTRGYRALVDDEDFEELSKHNWHALGGGGGGGFVYAARKVTVGPKSRRAILMHRQIMGVVGASRRVVVDHDNHNTLDNRRSNLKVTDQKGNMENRRGLDRSNTSGYRGVSWHKRECKWQAIVGHEGRLIHGGYYADIEAANQAAIALRRLYLRRSREHLSGSPSGG